MQRGIPWHAWSGTSIEKIQASRRVKHFISLHRSLWHAFTYPNGCLSNFIWWQAVATIQGIKKIVIFKDYKADDWHKFFTHLLSSPSCNFVKYIHSLNENAAAGWFQHSQIYRMQRSQWMSCMVVWRAENDVNTSATKLEQRSAQAPVYRVTGRREGRSSVSRRRLLVSGWTLIAMIHTHSTTHSLSSQDRVTSHAFQIFWQIYFTRLHVGGASALQRMFF